MSLLKVLCLGVVCMGLAISSLLLAQEPRLRGTLKGDKGKVLFLAFSPDGKTLASGSGDGTIKLWNLATDK